VGLCEESASAEERGLFEAVICAWGMRSGGLGIVWERPGGENKTQVEFLCDGALL
jgi:hypothetical protein